MPDSVILDQVQLYSDALGKFLPTLGSVVDFLRGLRNTKVRAMRLRHQAARLYRVSARAAGQGYHRRAANLLARAEGKWKEALLLDPVDARTAAVADRPSGSA